MDGYRVSFSDAIGILGIVLAVVLVVLDKAGKLKGEWLVGLLLLAGVMTLFIAIGNPWVLDGPARWRIWRGLVLFSVVAFVYSGAALWVSESSGRETREQSAQTSDVRARIVEADSAQTEPHAAPAPKQAELPPTKANLRVVLLSLADEIQSFLIDRRTKYSQAYSNLADQQALAKAWMNWQRGTAQEFDVKYKPRAIRLIRQCKQMGIRDEKLNQYMGLPGPRLAPYAGDLEDYEIRSAAEKLVALAGKLAD